MMNKEAIIRRLKYELNNTDKKDVDSLLNIASNWIQELEDIIVNERQAILQHADDIGVGRIIGERLMGDWIDCNMVWNYRSEKRNKLLFPDLKDEMKEKFGESSYNLWSQLTDIQKDSENSKYYQAFKELRDKEQDYLLNHTMYKQYKKELEHIEQEEKEKSFAQTLAKSGVLIEIKDGDNTKTLLIGDINKQAGSCDCCCDVNDDDIVLRYKVVYDK